MFHNYILGVFMKALAEPMRDYFYTGETLDINFGKSSCSDECAP